MYTALQEGRAILTYSYGEYYKKVETITVTGIHLEKKGVYDENLTKQVYDALADNSTRRTDLSIDNLNYISKEQLNFLLETADKWYSGEIATKKLRYLMQYTPFPINETYKSSPTVMVALEMIIAVEEKNNKK